MVTSAAATGRGVSGRDRILEAAVVCFAERGFAGTSLKVIATAADVSPALIVHHFGTKEALHEACDAHVLAAIREQLRIAAAEGAGVDVLEAFRRRQSQQASALPYLARGLVEGWPSVCLLVDELADDVVSATEQQVAAGVYTPTAHPRERALVLLIWSLGALALHEHVQRLLGADLTGEPVALLPYLRGATEILTDGLFGEALRDAVHDAIARLEQE
jgi:AcrR family transcriptional regulator